MKVEWAGGVHFQEFDLRGAPWSGGRIRSQIVGAFQIPVEGEPHVSGELDLGQTALPETGQQLADFKGATMAPVGDGMLHAGDSADRVYSAVDAVVGAHTVHLLDGVGLVSGRVTLQAPYPRRLSLLGGAELA